MHRGLRWLRGLQMLPGGGGVQGFLGHFLRRRASKSALCGRRMSAHFWAAPLSPRILKPPSFRTNATPSARAFWRSSSGVIAVYPLGRFRCLIRIYPHTGCCRVSPDFQIFPVLKSGKLWQMWGNSGSSMRPLDVGRTHSILPEATGGACCPQFLRAVLVCFSENPTSLAALKGPLTMLACRSKECAKTDYILGFIWLCIRVCQQLAGAALHLPTPRNPRCLNIL